jgi:electron transfer flavoprotein beta subunit
VRRLDGGRREILAISGRAVLSVEGSTARLRRASLRSVIAADSASIDVRTAPSTPHDNVELVPYRPRARVLPAPSGASALDRVRVLTDAGGTPSRSETVVLEPTEAARRILQALREWGYLT